LSYPRLSRRNLIQIKESKLKIQIATINLFFLSLISGFYLKDIFIGIGSDVFNGNLFYYCTNTPLIESEFTSFGIKILPLTLSFFGITLVTIITKLKLLHR